MEKWEYLTEFVFADIENEGVKAFLQERSPNWKNLPKYVPQTMIPHLNTLGERGWELVHMEPVAGVGKNNDVWFTGTNSSWSNVYFCVFKRRKQE